MDKQKWLNKLGINKEHTVIFFQNPNRFALTSLQKVDKNPTHSYYLVGYLKKSICKSKKPKHRIKVCKVIKNENSFIAFLGQLPFLFRDMLQVGVANINFTVNPLTINPIFLTVFAVPFAIIFTLLFIKVSNV